MPRRGSRGRRARSQQIARHTPAPPSVYQFDEPWLQDFRERGGRFADLTDAADRRRWHPSSTWPTRSLGLSRHPRIVIVPEGHVLARHQTYGGRYSYADVMRKRPKKASLRYGSIRTWLKSRERGPHGVHDVLRSDRLPYRIGFTLPWQVVICVRRKRRTEVLHAFKKTGKGSTARMKKRRMNKYSDVRC